MEEKELKTLMEYWELGRNRNALSDEIKEKKVKYDENNKKIEDFELKIEEFQKHLKELEEDIEKYDSSKKFFLKNKLKWIFMDILLMSFLFFGGINLPGEVNYINVTAFSIFISNAISLIGYNADTYDRKRFYKKFNRKEAIKESEEIMIDTLNLTNKLNNILNRKFFLSNQMREIAEEMLEIQNRMHALISHSPELEEKLTFQDKIVEEPAPVKLTLDFGKPE